MSVGRIGRVRYFGPTPSGAEPLFGETVDLIRLSSGAGGSAATAAGLVGWSGGAITVEAVLLMVDPDPNNAGMFRVGAGAPGALQMDCALDRQGAGATDPLEMRLRINGGAGLMDATFFPAPSPGFPALQYVRYSWVISGPITAGYAMRTYANGALVLSAGKAGEGFPLGVATGPFQLNTAVNRTFHCTDLRVWDGEQSAADILALWNVRLAGTEPNLLRYWRLDEGVGNPVDSVAGQVLALGGGVPWINDTIQTAL